MTAAFEGLGALVRTTAFRLASYYVAAFLIAGAGIATLVYQRSGALLAREVAADLADERAELAEIARARGLPVLAATVRDRGIGSGRALYVLADSGGVTLAGNLSRLPAELEAGTDGALFRYMPTALRPAPAAEGRGGSDRLAYGTAIAVAGGARLVVARDVEQQLAFIAELRALMLWSLGGLGIAGLAGGILAGRMLLRRVESLTRTSRAIMAGNLGERLPLAGTADELDDLAAGLNAMLDRIEALMAGLREVSDNIAHDLKTPLTRLRNRVEAALADPRAGPAWREGLEATIEEADGLIKTFNALLLVARLEAGAPEDTLETFDLGALLADVVDLYEPVAEEAGLPLAVTPVIGPPLRIRANRQLVGQAVANLVDNAIKYGRPTDGRSGSGAAIAVALSATPEGLCVRVADRGPGIPEADRVRALKRFVRLEASRTRPGTGLGLSLVAAVARMHGGSVRLDDNHPGLVAELVLPSRLAQAPEQV